MALSGLLRTIADANGLTGEDLRRKMRAYDGSLVDAYFDGTQQPDWDFVAAFLDVVAGNDRWRRELLERQIRAQWGTSGQKLPLSDIAQNPAPSEVTTDLDPDNSALKIPGDQPRIADGEFQSEVQILDETDANLSSGSTHSLGNPLEGPHDNHREGLTEDGSLKPKGSSSIGKWAWIFMEVLITGFAVVLVLPSHLIDRLNLPTFGEHSSSTYGKPSSPSIANSVNSHAPGGWPDMSWSGDLLLSNNGNVDLSTVPPNVNSNDIAAAGDITLNGGSLSGLNPIASWDTRGAPTAKGCATLVITEGVHSITPAPGQVICVRTSQGDIAILVVKKNNLDTSQIVMSTLVQATVWSK